MHIAITFQGFKGFKGFKASLRRGRKAANFGTLMAKFFNARFVRQIRSE